MPLSIDPRQVQFKRVHGEFMALYTYVNDERAMILFPHRRRGLNGAPPPWAIVCDSSAFKYADDEYLMLQAMTFCRMWDMTERSTVIKVATIINEGLSDLIRLKPKAEFKSEAPVLGEADLLIGGDKIATHEITMPEVADVRH